jgi:aspartate/methionine/tyrosine aminotransferase
VAIHESRRSIFARRRELLSRGLATLGFRIPVEPAGAFYLYVDVSHTGMDAQSFCWRLIDEFQVAVTPGVDFGENAAEQFVRFAYTTSEADIERGLERISRALDQWNVACG